MSCYQIKKGVFLFFIGWSGLLNSQTIGAVYSDNQRSDDFILFSPISYSTTYLIDQCGYVINAWDSDYAPGLSAVLDQEGNLYRTARIGNSTFVSGGGTGGIIEKYNWAGELLSSIVLSSDSTVAHHDLIILSNGHLLVSIWELVSIDEVISLGRDPSLINSKGFWNERILEINILIDDQYEVLWEWSALDHVIQDIDIKAPNYGQIKSNPGRLDINSGVYSDNIAVDWLHFNSINYNEKLDQILLSSKSLSEIFIIDKSTTTIESQGITGGNADKGGDLLFRWGNANNYLEEEVRQLLFGQHDANWIIDQHGNALDKIILFNNLNSINGSRYSSVLELSIDRENFNYSYLQDETSQEDDILWEYISPDTFDFNSKIMSGARKLLNGNYLICEATKGRIIEIDTFGEVHWEYICPINAIGPMTQFDPPVGNTIFKAIPYGKEYFNSNLNLTSTGVKIEFDPVDNCDQILNNSIVSNDSELEYTYYNGNLKLSISNAQGSELIIIDKMGNTIFREYNINNSEHIINITSGQLIFVIIMDYKKKSRTVKTIYIP